MGQQSADSGAAGAAPLWRARSALIAAGDALLEAHDYDGAGRVLRIALDRWPADDENGEDGGCGRLGVIDRLARCAEMCSEHAEALLLLRELAAGRERRGEVAAFAATCRRLATAHELGGQWNSARAAREKAAAAFAAAGMPAEGAVDRLAMAAQLRAAASYSAALDMLASVAVDATASGRIDLVLRAEGLRGNVLTRLGRAGEGVPAVRTALDGALLAELPAVAAELQQRLADSLEHSGDYQGAIAAYGAGYLYCDTHGADVVGQLCRACATAVLFSRGEWELAVTVCSEVLAEPDSAVHPAAVSACMLGLIEALRGTGAAARPALLQASAESARIELTAVRLLSAWGLAVLESQSGAVAAATDRLRQALALLARTQERHYCLPMLQWAATFFAAHGLIDDARACAAALSAICEATAQPEATATLAHALGETLLASDPRAAASELARAAAMFGELGLPFAGAQAQHRAACALAGSGDADGARELLVGARGVATRLGARPLADSCAAALAALPGPRAAADAPARDKTVRPLAGLTARELDVMVLVAAGNTSREVGAALFISPRTVEMHVQGCLLKLGCRTRAEAVRKLTELGALTG
jgi:DNA-binding CsgD family transcriptional regulator/tetratricopeptide (TPR) repeat protein